MDEARDAPLPAPPTQIAQPGGPLRLFVLFSRLALIGFGGVLPWARRMLVDNQKILTPAGFAEVLAFAQLLPGPTICNLAIIVGHRSHGIAGGCAALAGLVVPPSIVVLALGYGYRWMGAVPVIQDALRGMSVVAAALVAAMALQMSRSLPWKPAPVVFAAAMFTGVGLLHWPLPAVLVVLAGLSVAISWKAAR
jgi:chromate transporter